MTEDSRPFWHGCGTTKWRLAGEQSGSPLFSPIGAAGAGGPERRQASASVRFLLSFSCSF